MATTAEPLDHSLERAWSSKNNLEGVLGTVDHKVIGVRYMFTAFLFFCLAGLQVLFVRAQLAVPENNLLSPEAYNQFFTMHGTTMVFFFATPVLFGFGNFLIPLMTGTRDMAFPRLNAFGYWVFLLSGLFMYSSFLVGLAPDGGWFAYTPLTGPQYSPGLNLDFWNLGLLFLSISTTAGALNFIVSIFKMRAPGHVDQPHAAVCVGYPGHLLRRDFRGAFAHLGQPAADAGAQVWLPLLPDRVWRQPTALAAPVLGLWPPGCLHHLPAGGGHGV